MRRWFLSYHSPDQALAEQLKAALERKDTGAHVFFAPSSLRAGGFWSRALAEASDWLPVLLGNWGVGKSSLAQAGVLAALKRQAWPEAVDTAPGWPHAFQQSRRWCFLTLKPGTEPLKALVESFLDTWQLGATDPERAKQQN